MTRLFIRFYLGVLFILFAAAVVQNVITQRLNASHNLHVVEEALSGGVRLARDTFSAFPQIERYELLREVQSRFSYPVEIVPFSSVPEQVALRLAAGDEVVFHYQAQGGMLKTSLVGTSDVLSFGPLPQFASPSQLELLIGLIVVLAVTAVAIALLLRPVAQQFRLIESTAMQLAAGDFTARVDERRVASTRDLAQAFNYMAGRTETLLRTQRELLQAVSHELRTPLSRIQFATDLIRTSKTDAEREARLKSVEDATEELDLLVGELLRYVRIETSEPEIHSVEIELLPLLQGLVEKTSLLHPDKTFEIGNALKIHHLMVRSDRSSLERALGNLLNNAGQQAETKILIDAEQSADCVEIIIDDDGPGIAVADRERVFEPFVRLNQSGTGTGLGLAIVRRIATLHGGRVYAAGNEFGGCRMHLSLPRHDVASPKL
jgi:two-component system, OmpR family, sensor histidine kinase RstB